MRRFSFRALLRAVHRDCGYLAVGLTLTYAVSGLAVNHIADWDPNFRNTTAAYELGAMTGNDDAIAAQVARHLSIRETPRDVYRNGNELELSFDHRTLHVDTTTGHVLEEAQKPRWLVRSANWLHLNRGKKAWTYVADSYAAALLFLAISGMFMIAGKKGLFGRGAVLVAIGVAIPIAYVVWSGR